MLMCIIYFHWKVLKMLRSRGCKLQVLLVVSQKGYKYISWYIFHQLNAVTHSHLVGQQDAGDRVSVGQHGLVVQVLFPMATAEEARRATDVKHDHTAWSTFIIDPAHGYEALLACTKFTVSFIYQFLHRFIHPFIQCKRFCTCDIPQLHSDFFFIWPVQQLHRKIHWRNMENMWATEKEKKWSKRKKWEVRQNVER